MSALGADATLQSLLDELDKWGAALAQTVFRDGDDVPVAAVIVVRGQPEAAEVVAAVEAVQAAWDGDTKVVASGSPSS